MLLKKTLPLLFLSLLCQAALAQEIRAVRVDLDKGFFQKPEPAAAVWNQAEEQTVPMFPQSIATPSLFQPSISRLTVRALHNRRFLALRLEWEDKTRSASLETEQASDACAIQFPLKEVAKTSPFMGGKEFPVAILHWKAIWQQDVERGYQQVKDLHPNTWVDTYRFGIDAATELHNPVSQPKRKVPVEMLMASGFGTLTTQPKQTAFGWGTWQEGKWTVVLSKPFRSRGAFDPVLREGEKTAVGFALWEGGNQDVGARKNYAPWVDILLEVKK